MCLLFVFLAFAVGGGLGVKYGKEIAADTAKKDVFFIAYGKKYKATEASEIQINREKI